MWYAPQRVKFYIRRINPMKKILAIVLALVVVVAAFAAIAFIVYKLFVKNLEKCYNEEDEELFLEEDDSCDCECLQCEAE